MTTDKGFFTMPGEAGYEALTLELARKFGADVIRDSDGTDLPDELLNSGLDIYSTICVIRGHNAWAKENMDKLQQCFLSAPGEICTETELKIDLMASFFDGQFGINETEESMEYWQVWNRTDNTLLPRAKWRYEDGIVIIEGTPWNQYSVSFLANRLWEEISMYNHTTNNWDTEREMPIEPMHEETREYLKGWLKGWCEEHPKTKVVRFTSLFYNFVWIWGKNPRNRNLFVDWASYDFTVSLAALKEFEKRYGYKMTAEDFVNKGKYRSTHSVPDSKKLDWLRFINDFTVEFAKELIDIVKSYGKLAYVFYDDSWVGMEPQSGRFGEMGFDGIIKCVFSGFEARLCAAVAAETRELRLHPYLFPVGLGGLPTFSPGGNPSKDALGYWVNVRRALLREKIDRIGLGGYPSLTLPFPDFAVTIAHIADEFRKIRKLHESGSPAVYKPKIAVLHAWGKLRKWTLSGHFHETDSHTLIHVLESLSGLPFDVTFLDFNEARKGVPEDVDIVLNAGRGNSAWSGRELWADRAVVEKLTEWVHNGGTFLGINEPSYLFGYSTALRMSHVLGIDIDDGRLSSHGKWIFDISAPEFTIPDGTDIPINENAVIASPSTEVWLAHAVNKTPVLTRNKFGAGQGIYLAGFRVSAENTRLLFNLLLHVGDSSEKIIVPESPYVECAYFKETGTLAVINNSDRAEKFRGMGLEPFGMVVHDCPTHHP